MNWIEIKNEGMPNHFETVLCYNANEQDCEICLGVSVNNETEFYLFELGEKSKQVTHYMELPEKPKSI
jgi:dTDP-glucose pyrophosphorylase